MGSSFLPGEVIAAFLWAQLEEAEQITKRRISSWNRYHEMMADLEENGFLRRPIIPSSCQHNAHMYYILLESGDRGVVLEQLKLYGIHAVFHYIPLHSSPAGLHYGRAHGDLAVTTKQSGRLIRMPIWVGLEEAEQNYILQTLGKILLKV